MDIKWLWFGFAWMLEIQWIIIIGFELMDRKVGLDLAESPFFFVFAEFCYIYIYIKNIWANPLLQTWPDSKNKNHKS